MLRKGFWILLVFTVTACSIKSNPVSIEARYREAQRDVRELFDPQKKIPRKISYYEALARSIKYNLDYRIKLTNIALQAGQLKVAEFTMFPALNVSGSIYTRNNDLSSFGTTTSGALTDVLNSTPRTLRSARIGLSWNILDFGLGYVRAKQQSNRILIAEEESRKQVQKLAQDVLVAYWKAYSAQELIRNTLTFQGLLTQSKALLEVALQDKTIPQENILNYQGAILEGNRRLVQLRFKYNKAMLDLKLLLNISPDQPLSLLPPPKPLTKPQNLRHLDFRKLDAITLVARPELRGQAYQKRIAEFGVKTAILQALPGFTLNSGWNYNSNRFLINRVWIDKSIDVAWNLLNLASLPATYNTAKLQVKYENLKRMALTIGVLTESRYAYWHYQTLSEEYVIAHKQTLNAQALYQLNYNREAASLASNQQVILAKLKLITSQMDESLLLSDMSTALGELYLSTGTDLVPIDVYGKSIAQLTDEIEYNFIFRDVIDFKTYVNNTYKKLFASIHKCYRKPVCNTPHKFTLHRILGCRVHTPIKIVHTHVVTKKVSQRVNRAVQSKKTFTIQIMGSYHLKDILNVQTKLPHSSMSFHGKTKHNSKDWYILTLGEFPSADAARAHIKQLPASIAHQSAWVRSIDDVQWLA